jgi:hypothetical protein
MMSNPSRVIDAQQIETSIMMLKQYAREDDIAPLIDVLESMAEDPCNEALLDQLSDVFGRLGLQQGVVLTYAPYLSTILSDGLFDDTD